MGNVVPLETAQEFSARMFLQMDSIVRMSVADRGEPDVPAVAQVLDTALSSPHGRTVTLHLAHYLSSCLAGSIPDLKRWTPPR